MILGVDPGTRDLGWALWSGAHLMKAGIVRATGLEDMLPRCATFSAAGLPVTALTIERPQLYGLRDRSDPNKIGQLLVVAGRVSAAYPHARLRLPFPRDWKGQVPKHIQHRRLMAQIGETSRRRLQAALAPIPASVQHNVLDAVGLALWTAEQET